MRKTLQLAAALSIAAALGLPAGAEEHHGGGAPGGGHPGPGAGRPGPGHPGGGQPGFGHPGGGQPGFGHPGGGQPGFGHPGGQAGMVRPGGHPVGGFRGQHNIGERGYSFHVGGPGRREIRFFSPREHELWRAGRWHHEMRFGRLGYWYEVDGAWYFYDRPFDGPPTYVSEVEFFDPDLGPPAVVAPAPVVVAPAPVVVVPPAVCVGPLCIR